MRALVCDPAPRLVDDRAEPARGPGEALVALGLAGICDTDLQIIRGYMGFRGVIGHEFVGVVLESDDPRWKGRRVVADINAGCGVCVACARGDAHHCPTRTVLGIAGRDGALAERFVVPERSLVAVPDDVPDEHAVFAEPLAAALHVTDELGSGDDSIVVLGDGKLGLLIARALVSAGKRPLLVGHHEEKLGLARAAGVEAILEHDFLGLTTRADVVVEATGSASGLALALRTARPRGTVILKTTVSSPHTVDLSPAVIHELRIVGSRCGDMARAVDALARGVVDPTSLVVARYPLARAEAALAHAARPGALKVLVSAS